MSHGRHSWLVSGRWQVPDCLKRFRITVVLLVAWAVCFAPIRLAHAAGEPAADFLKRLRSAHYFDIAIAYLDRLDQFPGIDPELKKAIPLEKAQVFIDAAVATRNVSERDDAFGRAESQLKAFIQQGDHARVAEARLQLGKLQMVRAAQLLAADPDDQQRQAARQSYLAAAKTFDKIVNDLRKKLQQMRGQRIDAEQEPEKAALRIQYRAEFLQAQLRGGEARQLAAKTFADPATEGKQLLEEALSQFNELSDKYADYVQGAKAILYRGQVQQTLGQTRQAADSYLRMLEQSPIDALRESKFQANSGLLELSLAADTSKGDSSEGDPGIELTSAIERAQGMLDNVRPDEQRLPSVGQLRVNLAKAYLRKSKSGEDVQPADRKRANRAGRQLLLEAQNISGPHQEEATRLLADLGIEKDETKTPIAEDPESLQEALKSARQLLHTAENLEQSLEVLRQRNENTDEVDQQIAEITGQLQRDRTTGIQVLRRGLAKLGPETEMAQISQARQYLAYLLYQQKRYREAAVVGSFLAHHSPGNERGLSGGLLALNSLQRLLAESPSQTDSGLVAHLERLGDFLTKTWPEEPRAQAAQGVMIRLALSEDRSAQARELIERMPEGAEKARFRRMIGQLTWNRSIKARQAGNEAEADQLLKIAKQDLQAGLQGIAGNPVEADAMQPALILAKIHLRQNEAAQAVQLLDHPKYGPLALADKYEPPTPQFKTDLYQTELRAVVGQMTAADSDTEALLGRATESMQRLTRSAGGGQGEDQVVGILLSMAKDIREQLDAASPARKAKLVDAFRLFLSRITADTEDPATLQWAGQTLTKMGESVMQPGARKASGQAADLFNSAVETFQALLESSDDLPLTVNYQLGRVQRLLGRYRDALDQFETVLKQKPMMLDAQIEAALAYEQWAAEVSPRYRDQAYDAALTGARPNAEGENIIWGWGRISQLTNRDPNHRDKFFEARYHVALCRYLKGKALDSDRVIEQAISDITKVAALYPELGGNNRRQKFDRLLKEIQKAAGKTAEGLSPAPTP